jgi:outer membrane protein assembly factor BamB
MSEIVRLAGVLVAAVLALAAAAAAMVPLALRQHRIDTPQVFSGSTTIFAVPVSGGVPRRVMTLRGQWNFPVADGHSLLIERPTLTRTALWLVPLDGGAMKRVGDLSVFAPPAWSPDFASYATFSGASIVVNRLNGDRIRTLTRSVGAALPSWNGAFLSAEVTIRPATGYQNVLDVWRADGTLAWTKTVPGPLVATEVASNGASVALVRLHRLEVVTRSGTRVLASDPLSTPVWTRNGRSLLYWDTKGRLVLRDVRTGAVRVVTQGRIGEFALSADGKTVYLTRVSQAVSMPK